MVGIRSLSWSEPDLDCFYGRIRIPLMVGSRSSSLLLTVLTLSWSDPDPFHGLYRSDPDPSHGWIQIYISIIDGSNLYHGRIRIPLMVGSRSSSLLLTNLTSIMVGSGFLLKIMWIFNPALYLVKPKTTLRGKWITRKKSKEFDRICIVKRKYAEEF